MNKIIYLVCLCGLPFCVQSQTIQTLNIQITNGSDDVEVSTKTAIPKMLMTSNDLELGGYESGKQYVGLRFQNVALPADARIRQAYIQFTAHAANATPSVVSIKCQQGNAQEYGLTENLLLRPYVSKQINWNAPAWTVAAERGERQKTPNLAAQVRMALANNWESGNSLSFILTGNATVNNVLSARSFESNATHLGVAELVVEYSVGGGNSISMADLNNVFINELAPKGTIDFPNDWLEIYNANDSEIAADSIYITDNETNPFKWGLKNVYFPPKGFVRLIADKDTLKSEYHINLKLSPAGDTVYLFKNVDGTPVRLASFEYPATTDEDVNITFGTATDGILDPKIADLTKFLGGTPEASNTTGKYFLRSINNVPRGIVEVPTSIALTAPDSATIRYTTNFTNPSRTNGTIYTEPIVITTTTVLKVFTYSDKGESNIETFTYIFPIKGPELHFPNLVTPEEYTSGLKQLPIVAISILPGGNAVDVKMEQICNFEYIQKFGEVGSIGVVGGVEGYGNSSYLRSEQKNLRVHFRSQYGYSNLDYPIFKRDDADSKNPFNKFDVLELKIGQDGPNTSGYTMLMASQGLLSKSMRELGHVDLHTQYVHAFVNGKYHGIFVLKEKYTELIERTYNQIQETKYDVVEASWSSGILNSGSLTNWLALKSAVAQNRYQDVKKHLEVSQFIDFMIFMMYFDNDWEFQAIADRNLVTTKFLFENHDTDGALSKNVDGNSYNYEAKWTTLSKTVFNGPAGLFGNLLKGNNKEFKTLVRDRVYKLLQKPNAVLTVASLQAKLLELKTELRPTFNLELARFNQTGYNTYDGEFAGVNAHLPIRYQFNLTKWLQKGLAHTLVPVTFSQPEGTVTDLVTVANSNNKGVVYYTIDGSDPMGNDGTISTLAQLYTTHLALQIGKNDVVARVYFNGEFGPKAKADYVSTFAAEFASSPIQAERIEDNSFSLSPNPARTYTDIDLRAANHQPVELTISNQLGTVVFKQIVENTDRLYRLPLKDLASGTYILSIQVEGQNPIARKLTISH